MHKTPIPFFTIYSSIKYSLAYQFTIPNRISVTTSLNFPETTFPFAESWQPN